MFFSRILPAIAFFPRICHIRRMLFIIFIGTLILLSFPSMAGSNYFLEKKISLTLLESDRKKDIIWLKTGEARAILALKSPSKSAKMQGGIIILADLYQPPDWPVIVHGLRQYLPNYGWETLSVQLPIPNAAANTERSIGEQNELYNLTQKRIDAAVAYFKNKNINNISLIGINQSANFGLKYAASQAIDSDNIQSIVSIRAYDSSWLVSSDLVKNISLPLLDIIPEYDNDIILLSAKRRLIAAGFAAKMNTRPRQVKLSPKVQKLAINKTGNLRYRQKVINGANAYFNHFEFTLFKTIRGWLGVYASGTKVTVN